MRNIFRSSDVIRFTIIALLFLAFVKIVIIDGLESYRFQKPDIMLNKNPIIAEKGYVGFADLKTDQIFIPETRPRKKMPSYDFSETLPQPESIENKTLSPKIKEPVNAMKEAVAIPKPQWDGKKKARIAIIIDDMGMAREYTRNVIDLDAPLTLAFLPYANNLLEFTEPAKRKGHQLIIHVPMEPMNSKLNLGPAGLTTSLDKDEFLRRLDEEIFTSFEGYVGINNHMGSRLTQDIKAMNWLMPVLKEKGLLFVDSKTIHTSVAAQTAHKYGVEYAERDVFLDHNEDLESVVKALMRLEELAKQNGVAIAIGHPKKNTIKALELWMPSLAERGLELVPVSDLVQKFEEDNESLSLMDIYKSRPPALYQH